MTQRNGIESFAVGRDGKISAWCIWRNREKGEMSCLSGGYDAVYSDGAIRHPTYAPVVIDIVWEGLVPMAHANNYNDAIIWMQGALDNADM